MTYMYMYATINFNYSEGLLNLEVFEGMCRIRQSVVLCESLQTGTS